MEDVNHLGDKRQTDGIEKLDYADRVIRDGFAAIPHPGFFVSTEIDMTRCAELIQQLRDKGVRITYTHIFIRAVALVLSKHPDLHMLLKGTRRLLPAHVDIGLSVQGDTVVAPVMVIANAESKTLQELADEVIKRTPETLAEDIKRRSNMQRLGIIIPFGFMRRLLIRRMLNRPQDVRKAVGTFQISTLKQVDLFVPFLITANAVLGVGRVRDRVLVIDGKQEIRPTAIVSCCADHKAWDGARAAKFMTALNDLLQSDELKSDCKSILKD